MSTLDSFVQSSRPPPQPVTTSQEIRDRGSIFVGNIYRATTPLAARAAVNHLKYIAHGPKPASHEIAAWRLMVLKHGQTGLRGPEDFEMQTGSEDDGEKWGGGKILQTMQSEGVIDAVVIVSRWYGGTLLGPARFAHIETCAREVCRAFKQQDEVDESISTLSTLDDILETLRADLSSKSTTSEATTDTATVSKKPPYPTSPSAANIAKLKRLIGVREKSIAAVKALLAKRENGLQAESTSPD